VKRNYSWKITFCTSQGSAATACRWGGHVYIFPVWRFLRMVLSKIITFIIGYFFILNG